MKAGGHAERLSEYVFFLNDWVDVVHLGNAVNKRLSRACRYVCGCVYSWNSPVTGAGGGLYPERRRGHRCAGSGFNGPGFTRKLTGQPVRCATADLYGRDRGSATCGRARNRCHAGNGSVLLMAKGQSEGERARERERARGASSPSS